MDKEKNRAFEMAKSYHESIKEDFKKLEDEKLTEEERKEIENDFYNNYGVNIEKVYSIILAGGGPAMRISGKLDENNIPLTAKLEYQDWFTPWTEYREADENILLKIAEAQFFE